MTESTPDQVLAYWQSIGPEGWFTKDDAIDAEIRERFLADVEKAARGELDDWLGNSTACLSLIILLDQFSRNLFRGDARSFAQDEKALAAARYAVEKGYDRAFELPLVTFFYMPFMHSESIRDQDLCLRLLHRVHAFENIPHGHEHRRIIARFGRFPHRNQVLGRHTSPAEQAFLDGGGFKG